MLHLTLLTQTSIQVSLRQMFWNVAFDLIKAQLLHILLLKVTVCYHIQPSVVFRMKCNLLKGYFIILKVTVNIYMCCGTQKYRQPSLIFSVVQQYQKQMKVE